MKILVGILHLYSVGPRPLLRVAYSVHETGSIRQFLSRVSILTRDIDIANLFVCLSVCLSVTFRYQIKTA